jgi:hypothetical protein
MPGWLARGLLVCAILLFHWKLVLTDQYTWLQTGDHFNLVLPWFEQEAAQWHRAIPPLWDPFTWGGQPLAGQGQPGAFFPLNWILFSIPLRDGWLRQAALHWYFVATALVAALSMYQLARELGRSRAASILAGFVFALGGHVNNADDPYMRNGVIFAPLVYVFLLRAFRGPALPNAVFSGAMLGLCWLSGHPQAPLLISIATAVLWLWLAWPRVDRALLLRAGAAAFAVAFLISAIQVLPLLEYGRYALRFAGAEQPLGLDVKVPYPIHAEYSLRPAQIFGIVWPHLVAGAENPYVGLIGAALAVFAVYRGWARQEVRWLAALALFAILFALGPNSLLHGVMYALVPMLDKARVPGAASVLFTLAAAALAAFGADTLARRWQWWLVAGVLFELYIGALQFPTKSDPAFVPLRAMSEHADIAAFVKEAYPARVFFDTSVIPYNFGDWYDVPALNGFAAGIPAGLWKLNIFSPHTQRLMGTRFHIAKEPFFADQREVFQSRSGLKVFESPDPLPRAWIVHQLGTVQTAEDGAALLADRGYDPRLYAYLVATPSPALERCEGSSAEVLTYRADRVEIRASAACRGFLTLSDPWFPGWEATIDHKPVEVLVSYGALRGMVVEKGEHKVVMRYRPASVMIGAGLSSLGLVVVAAALLRLRNPKRL